MNTIQALLALAALGAFLAVMVFHVPSIDLILVILLTFAFAAYDFLQTSRKK